VTLDGGFKYVANHTSRNEGKDQVQVNLLEGLLKNVGYALLLQECFECGRAELGH